MILWLKYDIWSLYSRKKQMQMQMQFDAEFVIYMAEM